MPNGHHSSVQTPRVRNGDPQPAHTPAPAPAPEPASAKRDLTSWWRQFSKRNLKKDEDKEPEARGIFGVPLITSIPYANVAISLFNEHGESYIYGYVPIVVAKCGVFLKEKATDVEGIFRLAGSEKRIKELKIAFDTPPRFGKGLDWTGYTVHDAANILRRYFNQLPEPIIPLQHYDPFRAPLRGHQAEAVGHIEGQAPSVGGFDPDAAVRVYQHLIKNLPSLNRQLLLYILDLLAVFAAKSDVNKMTTSNLAAIFQPGILSHPQHDMSPQDYRLSQDVLIFLIDNQDHFLIGMEGTAVDEGTVKHIESGPSTPQARTPTTPNRNKSGLGRSASTSSSAGAESLRKFGGIRRNVSTSSRHSRHSGAVPSPVSPSFATPTASGVHRSNTVPSKRSPALTGARFSVEKSSDPPTPGVDEAKVELPPPSTDTLPKPASEAEEPPKTATEPAEPQSWPPEKLDVPGRQTEEKIQETKPAAVTPAIETIPGAFPLPSPGIIPPSEESTPTAPSQPVPVLSPPPAHPSGQRSPHLTPTRERSEFMEAPVDSGPSVEPTPAVRTFTQILSKVSPSGDEKQGGRKPNKLQKKQRVHSANPSAQSSTHSLTGGNPTLEGSPSPLPPPSYTQPLPSGSKEALPVHSPHHTDTVSSRNSGTTLKPSMSPSASFRSHSTATEYSEAEPADEQVKEEKRSFWKSHKRDHSRATPTASQTDLHGSVPGADKSVGSFGSSSGWGGGRRSLQYESRQSSDFYTGQDTEKSTEKKSAFGWFHKKRQEHKENAEKKQRAKSPPGSSFDLPGSSGLIAPKNNGGTRGKSMDIPRPKMSDTPASNAPTGQGQKPLVAPQQETSSPPAAPTSPPTSAQVPTETPTQVPAQSTSETPANASAPASTPAPAPAPSSAQSQTTAPVPSEPASQMDPDSSQPSNPT